MTTLIAPVLQAVFSGFLFALVFQRIGYLFSNEEGAGSSPAEGALERNSVERGGVNPIDSANKPC